MRTRFPLLALIALAVTFAACSDAIVAPDSANFELVDADERIDESDINAHVYGTFSLTFGVATVGGVGVITSGPANFPGNPKNAGECVDGLWINPKGKSTSGSLDKPHPHCVGQTEGETTMQVILEPISAKNANVGDGNEFLQLATDRPNGDVRVQGGGAAQTSAGRGTIEAYAIDAATLSDVTPRRVGILTIDLGQYTTAQTNYFLEDCSLDISDSHARCLNKVIYATYAPLPDPSGVGEATANVSGFLYWSAATQPFNYVD